LAAPQDPFLESAAHRLAAAVDIQLLVDVLEVVVDRVRGDVKLGRDRGAGARVIEAR
jgi:hypothetical protein